MKVALFVEGGSAPTPSRRDAPLELIWRHIAGAVGFAEADLIVPISKKKPKSSGSAEGLDQLIARYLRRTAFSAAIVAWDSIPAWNPEAEVCRWNETLSVYSGLGKSSSLPEPWRDAARRRHDELQRRTRPAERGRPHRLSPNEVVAVCMEPMFEAMLFQQERQVFRAFDVGRRRPDGWPTKSWTKPTLRPDSDILIPLVNALRSGPRKQWPRIAKTIRADARYDKDPWLEYLLRRLLDDPEARELVLAHPICRRLAECLALR